MADASVAVSDHEPVRRERDVMTEDTTGKQNQHTGTSGIHQLKWIPWNDGFAPIVTQNENGPCPLLALCNVLILTTRMEVTPGETALTSQQLMDMLGSCLIESKPKDLDVDQRTNYEQNMTDAVSVFPRLLTGLDVNVKFGSVSGFEFTPELSIFDLLGVGLYHGWLVDPADTGQHMALAHCSYNQLVGKVIDGEGSDNPQKVEEGLHAQQFLENTASQLTYHGVCELNSRVSEGEMCVFFRNNHFNTLLKREGQLLLLVTDLGFLNEYGHVWHVLRDIDDSGEFLDAGFQPSSWVGAGQVEDTSGTSGEGGMEGADPGSSERLDYEIAAGLQAEEEGREAHTSSRPEKRDKPAQDIADADHELAMVLQQEELDRVQPSSANQQQQPPSTREEYEQVARQERRLQREESSSNCILL